MNQLLSTAASAVALVGGIVLFVALFTPRRFRVRRPARFGIGFGLLGVSAVLWTAAGRS